MTSPASPASPVSPDDDRHDGLLAWQHRLYANNHSLRATLVVHLFTVPLFWLGCVSLAVAPFTSPWCALGGLGLLVALVLEGRVHKRERAPVPFRGPGDFVARLFVEHWVTFPRWVLNGGFGKAWRAAK